LTQDHHIGGKLIKKEVTSLVLDGFLLGAKLRLIAPSLDPAARSQGL